MIQRCACGAFLFFDFLRQGMRGSSRAGANVLLRIWKEKKGIYPGDPQRGARALRALSVDRVDEIRCAYGGHARDQPDEFYAWPNGTVLWCAVADIEHAGRGQNL